MSLRHVSAASLYKANFCFSILAGSVPLERRAVFISSYSIMYGLATVIAPVIGGAFTSRVTWRWCFWIK